MKIDLLLKSADIYNEYKDAWTINDLAVHRGKILFVGNADELDITAEKTVDCEGRPLVPGMIDIHLHIESSYCLPSEFSRAVLSRGITTVVSEPHEMANVFGMPGIEEMIRLSRGCDADIFYGVPSSVPSTEGGLETNGGEITPQDAVDLFDRYPEIICVGEVMSYANILGGNTGRTREFLAPLRRRNHLTAIEGHCPNITGWDLSRVLYEGIDSDHCLQTPEGMVQRFEQGMFVEIQAKSLTPEIVNILKSKAARRRYSFVTDDTAPDILATKGHLDGVIRKALSLGLPLEDALIAFSSSPAGRIGFRDRGALTPGKIADFILLEDKGPQFEMLRIYKDGREANSGRVEGASGETLPCDAAFKKSIRLPVEADGAGMYDLRTNTPGDSAPLRTIVKNDTNTYTREGEILLPMKNGKADWENRNCNLILVQERYSGAGGFGRGILEGCFFKEGAAATSHSHDSHNILVVGDNRDDMEMARRWIIDNNGGVCVFSKGRLLASVALPVGGILSEEPMGVLSEKMLAIRKAMADLGFIHPNPLMSFSTLTLPVSPELKITDKGYVRTATAEILPLFV